MIKTSSRVKYILSIVSRIITIIGVYKSDIPYENASLFMILFG
jgi:hypothetical protein